MKRNLTLKNIMTDYAMSESQADLENNWLLFYRLTCMGYITNSTWIKFFTECEPWYFDTNIGSVCRDKSTEHEDRVIPISPGYIETVCK